MATDLFRINLSREIDRTRYLSAILSSRHGSFKRNLKECLRPDGVRTFKKSSTGQSDTAQKITH